MTDDFNNLIYDLFVLCQTDERKRAFNLLSMALFSYPQNERKGFLKKLKEGVKEKILAVMSRSENADVIYGYLNVYDLIDLLVGIYVDKGN